MYRFAKVRTGLYETAVICICCIVVYFMIPYVRVFKWAQIFYKHKLNSQIAIYLEANRVEYVQ